MYNLRSEKPITDQKSIATILNEYFTSIIRKLANKIKSTFQLKTPPLSSDLPYIFEFKHRFEEVDESFILRELGLSLKTNKATGLDQISSKLLKDSSSSYYSIWPIVLRKSCTISTIN